jgi:hypothetical protein
MEALSAATIGAETAETINKSVGSGLRATGALDASLVAALVNLSTKRRQSLNWRTLSVDIAPLFDAMGHFVTYVKPKF